MIRFFLLIFLFSFSLLAVDSSVTLKRANESIKSKNHNTILSAYNDYKDLYLRSVLEDNPSLKLDSLKGIIKSGKSLKIDVSNYEQELKLLSKDTKDGIKQNLPESKPEKITKINKSIHVESMHKLKSIKWSSDRLSLIFDKELDDNQISFFTLYDDAKKRYRYIFDISNAMLNSSQNIQKSEIDTIKIAQFTVDSLRLVVENDSKISITHSKNGTALEINFSFKNAQKEEKQKEESPAETHLHVKDKNKTIVVDAGHGGEDPGAIGYNRLREKDVVFDIAKELSSLLKSRGYKVYMTREGDEFIKLSHRTKLANEKGAHLFLSVHANAVESKNVNEANGIESFFLSPSRSARAKSVAAKENSADISEMSMYGKDSYLNLLNHHNIIASNKLAIDLQKGMVDETNKKHSGVKSIGVKEGPFWVLVGAQMPSVLVEVGFITHPIEGARLAEESYRNALAKGLADGVDRYFSNCN